MKKNFKTKLIKKKNIHINKWTTFFLIFLCTLFIFIYFNKHIKNNLIEISASEVKNIMYKAITNEISHEIINKDTIEDILVINTNDDGEILYVDFNLDKAYLILDKVSNILNDYISSLENGNVSIAYQEFEHDVNGIILNIPIGSVLNNSYFYNLGPKIPVKINFIGTIYTNLSTKITDYGLNNALVEVFIYIEFHNQILSSYELQDIELEYEAVIASTIINGSVPNMFSNNSDKVIEYETEIK